MLTHPAAQNIEIWLIDRMVEYPRNPRKNDPAVDRMCTSIREFGSKSHASFVATARLSMATSGSKRRASSV
jgi:hypothetical protein